MTRCKLLPVLVILLSLSSVTNYCAHAEKGTAHSSKRSSARVKRPKTFTEQDALRIVSSRAEVKRWKANVTSAEAKRRGVTANIEVDRKEGSQIVVHVYELVPDDAENSHTATFNWYYVDAKTGIVKTEF